MRLLQHKKWLLIGVLGIIGSILVGLQIYRFWQAFTGLAYPPADLEVIVCETTYQPAIPIKGVSVTVVGAGTISSGITDENGTLIWEDMSRGAYVAMIEKEGYLSFAIPLGSGAPSMTMMGDSFGFTRFQFGVESYQWTPPPGPYAYASVDPPAVLVNRGNSTTVTLTITPHNSFSGEVRWEIPQFEPYPDTLLPSELSLEFSTSSVTFNTTQEPSMILTTLSSERNLKSSTSCGIVVAMETTSAIITETASVTLTITVGSAVPEDSYILSIPLTGDFDTLYRPLLLGVT
jgi:hypothetical protein